MPGQSVVKNKNIPTMCLESSERGEKTVFPSSNDMIKLLPVTFNGEGTCSPS